MSHGSMFWVPTKEDVYIPCTSEDGSWKSVNGTRVECAKGEDDLNAVYEDQLHAVGNICNLSDTFQGAVLWTIRRRYETKRIYTCVARIIVALNPFQMPKDDSGEPLYSPTYMERYLNAKDSLEMDPHAYCIGIDAMKGLRNHQRKSQAILTSGESGAGKTESTKIVLAYMAEALKPKTAKKNLDAYNEPTPADDAGAKKLTRKMSRYNSTAALGQQETIQDKIIQTNPVLEAFGNAMTVRNNNSSRFGKWLQMKISEQLTIEDCSITDYLLELTRVTSQGEKERSYHIFFMCLYADCPAIKGLGVSPDPSKYNYIKKCQKTAPGIDDQQFFLEMEVAFNTLGFSSDVQVEIYKTVLGLLLLGNLNFETEHGSDGTDGSKLATSGAGATQCTEALAKLSEMWSLGKDDITKPFMIRTVNVAGQAIEKPCNVQEAKNRVDAMVRLIYGRLFKWLIAKINVKLGDPNASSSQFFGMLDIAGFEIFEQNSLEQLFINLANEILQEKFDDYFFELDKQECAAEGIILDFDISNENNKDIIDLINNPKTGVLAVLDEEMKMSKGDDTSFTGKVRKQHASHKRIKLPKAEKDLKFTICHFAGNVDYVTKDWMAKNADKPPDEAPGLFKASGISILQEIGGEIQAELDEEKAAKAGKKQELKTVGRAFRNSLKKLVDKLAEAEPHYIRCIKPNSPKKPNLFEAPMVNEQLIYSGVMEVVRIRQLGYAARVPFHDFCDRYPTILSRQERKAFFDAKPTKGERELAELLMEKIKPYFTEGANLVPGCKPIDDVGMKIGKTKVFAKGLVIALCEKGRSHALHRDEKDLNDATAALKAAIEESKTSIPPDDDLWAVAKGLEESITKLRTVMQLEKDLSGAEGDFKKWFAQCEVDIKCAEEAKVEANSRAQIREDLQNSVKAKDVRGMREAVKRAEEKGIQSGYIETAKQLIVQEQKAAALKTVADALKSRNVEDLRVAIEEGKLSGLTKSDLAEAEDTFFEEDTKDKVRKKIKLHIENRTTSLAALKEAVKEGEAAKLAEEELAEAKQVIKEEDAKVEARDGVAKAMKTREVDALEKAIKSGYEAKLTPEDLADAEKALEEEKRKDQARVQVRDAIGSHNIETLDEAIKEGTAAGLAEAELKEIKQVLVKEKRMDAARKRVEECKINLRTDLDNGLKELQKAIKEGEEAGLEANELSDAKETFRIETDKKSTREALAKAKSSPQQIDALEKAIADARRLELDEESIREAEVILFLERRKVTCRTDIKDAMDCNSIDALEVAITEAEEIKLEAKLIEEAKKALAVAVRKKKATEALEAATASRVVAELQAAIEEATKVGIPASEIEGPRLILEEEKTKEKSRNRVAAALKSQDVAALRDAVKEAKAARLRPEEIEEVQAALAAEERKSKARDALSKAVQGRGIAGIPKLQATLKEGEEAGLSLGELEPAKRVLAEEQKKERALNSVKLAIESRNMDELEDAIREMKACGLDANSDTIPEVKLVQDVLKNEQRKAAALEEIQDAREAKDIERLDKAVKEAEAAGVEASMVKPAKDEWSQLRKDDAMAKLQKAINDKEINVITIREALEWAAEVECDPIEVEKARDIYVEQGQKCAVEAVDKFTTVEDDFLPPHRELAFEIAWKQSRLQGLGGAETKARDNGLFSNGQHEERFVEFVESLWDNKQCDGKKCSIFDELVMNLRSSTVSKDGVIVGTEASGRKFLCKLAFELCQEFGGFYDEKLKCCPLAILCMKLYTQQDVDVDRMLLFQDTPLFPERDSGAEIRKPMYKTYREQVSREGMRNPTLSTFSGFAASSCCEGLRTGNLAEEKRNNLAVWIKTTCLLSAIRMRLDARTVVRTLVGLPMAMMEELRAKRHGDYLFWSSLLSSSASPEAANIRCSGRGESGGLTGQAILTINNVTEGLELFHLSQYPEEQEILLPMFSTLELTKNPAISGRPGDVENPPTVRLELDFVGTRMPERLGMACWMDLMDASADLAHYVQEAENHRKNPPRSPARGDASPPPDTGTRGKPAGGRGPNGMAAKRAQSPQKGTSPPVSPTPTPSAKKQTRGLSQQDFHSWYAIFSTMDQRGVFSVSHEDFHWAQNGLSRCQGFQRILRKPGLLSHFFEQSVDLSFHRFICLATQGAPEGDIRKMLRMAAAKLKEQRKGSKSGARALAN